MSLPADRFSDSRLYVNDHAHLNRHSDTYRATTTAFLPFAQNWPEIYPSRQPEQSVRRGSSTRQLDQWMTRSTEQARPSSLKSYQEFAINAGV